MRTRSVQLLAAAAVLFLSACGESTPSFPLPLSTGTMSFRYSSPGLPLAGTFAAAEAGDGAFVPGGAGARGYWRSSTISLFGTTGDDERAAIFIRGVSTGPAKIDAACQGECTQVTFLLRPTINGVRHGYECRLSAGTVTVLARSDDRIAGTFSGTGTCTSATTLEEAAIQVVDGAFDVATFPEP